MNNEDEIKCDYVDSSIWKSDEMKNIIDKGNIVYDYIIQKGSNIEANIGYLTRYNKNIWNLHNDPIRMDLNYWLKFDEINKSYKFVNNRNSIPFSVGGRACPGKGISYKAVEAFMGNFILKYQIIATKSIDYKNIKFTFGSITSLVDPQMPVSIKKRQS